tara:strand:- start:4241 stop:6244 length:2004 start_codon:yes stop_codon:yes gene_type:complete
MANGLSDLYEFDSFGGSRSPAGGPIPTAVSANTLSVDDLDLDSMNNALIAEAAALNNKDLTIGGIPIDQTMVSNDEMIQGLMKLQEKYNTNFTASDYMTADEAMPTLTDSQKESVTTSDQELESFLDEFAPQTTQEELNDLYPKEDYKTERRLALANFGLNLMQPTIGGQMGAVIANAGKQLTSDLAGIQGAKRKDAKERRMAVFNSQKEEEATRLNLASQVFLQNEQNEKSLIEKIYDSNLSLAETQASNANEHSQAQFEIMKDEFRDKYNTEVDDYVFEGEDGTLVGPVIGMYQDDKLFVQHPTAVDKQGFPVMVNYKLLGYTNPTSTDPTSDTDSKGGTKLTSPNKFIEIKNEIDNYDRVIDMALNVQNSLVMNPEFAGFTGAFLSWSQDKLQIVKDFRTSFFNDDVKDRLKNDKSFNQGFMPKSGQLLLPTDLITEDGKGATVNINGTDVKIFDDQTATNLKNATNIAYEIMKNDFANLQEARANGKEEITLPSGMKLGGQEADDLFGLMQFQKDLPLNEAASTAIIYALARARKASGRLNKDDIERAAATLNLYGESSKGVTTKLDFVINELKAAAKSQFETVGLFYGTAGNETDQKLLRGFMLQRIAGGKALPIIYNNREQLKLLGFDDDEVETIISGFKSFNDYSLPNQGSAPEKNTLLK